MPRHGRFHILASLSLVLVGCGDFGPEISAELDQGEPVATMQFSEGLPSLATLSQRWMPDGSLDPIVDRWNASWERSDDEGSRIRMEAIGASVPFLLAEMPDDELESLLGTLDQALEAVHDVIIEASAEGMEAPLRNAIDAHREATASFDREDRAAALEQTLIASDHLRSTTPEALARTLVSQGEEALRRISTDDSYPETTRLRGERLLIGARDALEGGDTSLALRRAWYAVGLLHTDEEGDGLLSPRPESEDPGP